MRIGVVRRTNCVLLSNWTNKFKHVLLRRGAAIVNHAFHEGREYYCQLFRMLVRYDSASARRIDTVVTIDDIEGIARVDIATCCSRGSKVLRMSD